MRSNILRKIPLFSSLPAGEIKYLASRLVPYECPRGHVLFHEGSREEGFYILLEGEVEIFKSIGGADEHSLGIRKAVSLLGEMSLFSNDGYRTATVRALTDLLLYKMDRAEFDALLHRQPQLAYEMVGLVSNRLANSENLTILELKEKNERLRVAYEELKAAQQQIIEKEKLEHELELSSQIQQSILPRSLPKRRGFDFGATMIPAHAVGGDFYTFLSLDKNHVGIVVGDVCDKGVPAALFMSVVYSLKRVEAQNSKSPVRVLRQVNRHLLNMMNNSSMFVTLIYGVLNCENGRFHYARAAHPAPILLDGKGTGLPVRTRPGQPLGLFGNLPIDEERIAIPPGGTLLLFTDGLDEASNADGIAFGDDGRLSNSLASARHKRAQRICEHLWDDIQAFGGGLPQRDDFTAVVIKRHP
ncbi:MAG TPA: SpoIIE family protein phosphatase [Anaerolineales bacterium]|nr:SpoIIE family protein phosphatase [Anaerolineales bacterium]